MPHAICQELNLYNNKIGARGTRHLATSMATNRTLQVLNLSKNQVGTLGARHLASALEVSGWVSWVHLTPGAHGWMSISDVELDGVGRCCEARRGGMGEY